MVAGYMVSRDPTARRYRGWRRFNLAPYRYDLTRFNTIGSRSK